MNAGNFQGMRAQGAMAGDGLSRASWNGARVRAGMKRWVIVLVILLGIVETAAAVDTDEKQSGFDGRHHSAIRRISAPHCMSLRSSDS